MAITVAGILRDSSNSPITGGSSKTMVVYLDGVSQESVETNTGDGTYSFASFAASVGQSVFVVIEGETEKGSVHTVTDGTTNLTAFDVRDTRFRIQNDNSGGSTTNPDLDDRDKDDDATNLFFTSNGGELVMDAGNVLEIVSGNTFAPGGDVTVGSRSVSSTLDLDGTWTAADGETYQVFGDVDFTGGTYNRATTDIFYFDDPTGGSGDAATLTLLGAVFSKIQVGSTPATSSDDNWSFDTMTVIVEARFDKGTLIDGTLTLKGDYIMDDEGGMAGGASLLIDGTGAQALTANGSGQTSNITINKASGTLTGTGSWDHNRNWTYTAGTVVMTGTTVQFSDNSTEATYVITSGTMEFNSVTIQALGSASVFQIADDIVVNGNFNLNKGHWDVNSNIFTLKGNYTDGGSDTTLDNSATSTLILSGTGTQTITPDAAITWSTLSVTNTGGLVTFATFGWTCATYLVAAGVSVTYQASTTFLATSAFTFSGASGNLFTFRSTSPSTAYVLRLQSGGTDVVTFGDVADADSSGGEEIVNTDGTDSGGNTNWVFPVSGPETQNIEARAGSFVCVVTTLFDAADAPSESTIFDVSDSTMASRLTLKIDSSGLFQWIVRSGGVDQADLTGTTVVSRGVKFVVIVIWENDDFRIYVNGSLEGSDNSGSVPTSLTGAIHIGDTVSSTLQAFSNIKHAYVIDHALHEEDVQRWNSFLEKQP